MKSLREQYLDIYQSIDFDKIIDHPNILIAARFWEEDRFLAAKTCYKFMRTIDDLIDDHKAANRVISDFEKQSFIENVDEWLKMIINGNSDNPFQKELTETIRKFRIPSWPLENFARSMLYDINNNGFTDLQTFMNYAGGASVAPAAIFVHLAGLSKNNGTFEAPVFNVKESATSCALFSYLVHIIRDFQKDQLNNLNYFADDTLVKYNLTRKILREIAQGADIPDGFRYMMGEYKTLAEKYLHQTYGCINNIWPYLGPRYQLSLEIIFNLYLLVFERIDINNGSFTAEELNPSPEESRQRVYQSIVRSRTLPENNTGA